jgi:hypothetical protein
LATNPTDDQDIAAVREAADAVPGVEHVVIDPVTRELCLILRADVDPVWTTNQVRDLAPGFTVRLAYRPQHRDRQRVRFVELRRDVEPDQQVSFHVLLEWAGEEYRGSATGDKGESVELRTIAAAALAAVGSIVPADLTVKLAGVKQVRAFDAELLVVSLYRPDAAPHNLVGAVVTGGDSQRAAVVSVLSALNRLLGNYLLLQ